LDLPPVFVDWGTLFHEVPFRQRMQWELTELFIVAILTQILRTYISITVLEEIFPLYQFIKIANNIIATDVAVNSII